MMTIKKLRSQYQQLTDQLDKKYRNPNYANLTFSFINTYEPDRDENIVGVTVIYWREEGYPTLELDLLTEYTDFEDFDVFTKFLSIKTKYQIEINERDDGILKFDTYQESVKKLEELISEEIIKRNGTNRTI